MTASQPPFRALRGMAFGDGVVPAALLVFAPPPGPLHLGWIGRFARAPRRSGR